MHACRPSLSRRYRRRPLHHREVPTRSFAERHWKDRAIPVDHVEPQKDRDLQPRLERRPLKFVRHLRPAHIERRPEQAFSRHLKMLRPIFAVRLAVELLQLTELFGNGHPRQERVDLTLDRRVFRRKFGRCSLGGAGR